MKKIILTAINAKYIHSNPAVYSLKAYANQYGQLGDIEIEIANYTINQQPAEIIADLYQRRPEVVAISCYIWNIDVVYILLKELKKVLPSVDIWLGGPEVSFDACRLMQKWPAIKGIILGEGEQTFLELATFYQGTGTLGEIAGIVYRSGQGEIVQNEQRTLIDLTKIPFLYHNPDEFENRIIYYESSRGCPFRCSYCLSSIDKTVRLRDIDLVKKELAFFIAQKVSQVKFIDRTFNCNKAHAKEIWNYILEHDNGITNFHFEVAADLLSEEELAILNRFRPGAVQLEIGVQSTNPQTIQEIDRVMNVEKLSSIVARIHEGNNVHIHLDLIAGLPHEDYTSFGKSFDDVFRMHPQQLQLGFLKVLKGSKMHRKAKDYGLLYTDDAPYEVLCTNDISYAEILRLKQIEEMVELFYNSNQFRTTLAALTLEFERPFAMFEALADFYEERGYYIQTPARSYRYHVLLEFVKTHFAEKTAYYKELLTRDLYLRENAKTRPDFAPDLSAYKDVMRQFYRDQMANHDILSAYEQYDARQMARMTHIEVFAYDADSSQPAAEPDFVLFDYMRRNPLTYEAETIVLKRCGNTLVKRDDHE